VNSTFNAQRDMKGLATRRSCVEEENEGRKRLDQVKIILNAKSILDVRSALATLLKTHCVRMSEQVRADTSRIFSSINISRSSIIIHQSSI
jgi:hypothetical protein